MSPTYVFSSTVCPTNPSATAQVSIENVTPNIIDSLPLETRVRGRRFHAFGHQWTLAAALGGILGHAGHIVTEITRVDREPMEANIVLAFFIGMELRVEGSLHFPTQGCATCAPIITHAAISSNPEKYIAGRKLILTVTMTHRPEPVAPPTADVDIPPSHLFGHLMSALHTGYAADVTLLSGEERIKAHSLILSQSPTFEAAIHHNAMPGSADATSVTVPDNIAPNILRRLLEFMYSGELEPVSAEEVLPLSKIA